MRARRAVPGWMLVLLVSCARAQPPAAPAPGHGAGPVPSGATPGQAATPVQAPTVPPTASAGVKLPVPASFREAVAAGTRTTAGRPGPRYWQQRASYRIQAELDPRTARVSADEHVAYVNASPDTLTSLVLHLYQNLFRPGAPRDEPTPTTDGMTLERVLVNGRAARQIRGAPGARPFYQVDNTLMGLGLQRPLLPGDTVQLDITWHFTVPPAGAPRMGHEGRELFEVAQWYPQLAVYDDLHGWDTHPYLGTGEFYLEYGDFDVQLTLPEGYLVAATGTLMNPDEVLTPAERDRLALAMRVDTVVHVLGAGEQAPGMMTQQAPGRQLTWRFRARSVRDFAFATSNRYLWDAAHVDVPDSDKDGKPDAVRINAFYRPEAKTWREAAAITRHAVAYHATHWLPYLYPQMTSAEGPEQGMEYPMLVFVSNYSDRAELVSTVIHEVGHQWFPMMVGSNEHEYAWQDEGLNTYIEQLATAAYMPGIDVWADDLDAYLGLAGTDGETPMMRPADLYGDTRSYAVASYMKPALVLRALGTVIGADKVNEGLRQYAAGWLLEHPDAWDFFDVLDSVAGQDLAWFWQPWFFTTGVLDQAVTGVQDAGAGRTAIAIENKGQVPMPVDLRLTFADGRTQEVKVPVTVWLGGARTWTETVATPAAVQSVVIDPAGLLPDVDRANNEWRRRP